MQKTVFFDLGNVLVNVNKKKTLKIFASELKVSKNKLLQFPESSVEKKFETGQINKAEYVNGVHKYFNFDNQIDYDYLKNIWQKPFTVIEDSVKILEQVREQTRVILLSNTTPIHIDAIKTKYPDLLTKFDDLIFSFTAGASKPDYKIYEFALEKTGIEPEHAIFIDDLEENIIVAQKIGIIAHQFVDPKTLAGFLNSYDFSIVI
ncbi:MAG: HAD family phosphatase [Candidatus Marinimicrobia bacterium]|nr:HAD family phosphatase [Candidatus Neomarinimicrobiota bacterium]